MAIANGFSAKKLTLYPPTKPSLDLEDSLWVGEKDNDPILPILTIDRALSLKEPEEDIMLSNFLQKFIISLFFFVR